MKAAFTPLVHRELLAWSRRRWTHGSRILVALIASAILVAIAWSGRGTGLGSGDGQNIMLTLFSGLWLMAFIEGFRHTHDCISRERREGTLGLLLLTDLNPRSILFAKLVSSSFQNCYSMLAAFPVLAGCLLAGGVEGMTLLRLALAVLATLWFSLSVGLYQSCRTEDDHLNFSRSLRLLVISCFIPLLSPLALLIGAMPFGGTNYFGLSLTAVLILGWAYWESALRLLKNNWNGSVDASAYLRKVPPALPTQGVKTIRGTTRLGPCGDQDPAHWIIKRYGDPRQASPRVVGWVIMGGVAFVALTALFEADLESFAVVYCYFTGLGRLIALATMCKIAPQGFGDAVRGGGVEILLTTPLTLKDLIRGSRRFLRREFSLCVIPLLVGDLALTLVMTLHFGGNPVEFTRLVQILLWTECLFLGSLMAAGSFGNWMGLRYPRLAQAAFRTSFFMIGLPPLLFFLLRDRTGGLVGVALYYALLLVFSHWRIHGWVESHRRNWKSFSTS